MLVHNTCELTNKQLNQIKTLRGGTDVSVNTVSEARSLLRGMPDIQPPNHARMQLGMTDPKGSYRGDLYNILEGEKGAKAYVHNPNKVNKNVNHSKYPHYNIYFHNGKKAAILITGGYN